MIIDKKDVYINIMHPTSSYEEFEKFMVLNSALIGICQEIQKVYREDFEFILYKSEEKPEAERRRQYFRQLVLKKIEFEKEMKDLIKKFGVFSKIIDNKRIFTDGNDD